MHDEAFGGDARLTVVDGARFHRGRDGRFQISGRHHDERIAAAEFQHRFPNLFSGDARDAAAGGFAAGERHRSHARIFNNSRDCFRSNQ